MESQAQEVGEVDRGATKTQHSQPAEPLRAEERLNLSLQNSLDLGYVRLHLAAAERARRAASEVCGCAHLAALQHAAPAAAAEAVATGEHDGPQEQVEADGAAEVLLRERLGPWAAQIFFGHCRLGYGGVGATRGGRCRPDCGVRVLGRCCLTDVVVGRCCISDGVRGVVVGRWCFCGVEDIGGRDSGLVVIVDHMWLGLDVTVSVMRVAGVKKCLLHEVLKNVLF